MSIFLIRHGETALNAARVLQPADTPLNSRGTAQAEALAQRLRVSGVARILSSDLPRALSTAEAIRAATAALVTTTSSLQERSFGDLRGMAYDDLPVDPIASEEAPPGGESMATFEARVMTAWDEIIAHETDTAGHLAVVTHGLVIRALLATIVPPERLPMHLGNASLTVLERHLETEVGRRDPGPHRFVAALINCTRHLDDSRRDDPHALSGG